MPLSHNHNAPGALENVSGPLGAQKKPSCGIPHQISFRQDTSSIFIPTLFYAA